jgi:hypothetical protein
MKYVYPKLSKYDFGLFRLGGPGLGNLLFIFARSIVFFDEDDCKIIWPTWASLKIGPWLRHEKDKRYYGDFFHNDGSFISGVEKMRLLITKRKFVVNTINPPICPTENNVIYQYEAFQMRFGDMLAKREIIKKRIFNIVKQKHKKALSEIYSNIINIHVRFGDFSKNNIEALNRGDDNNRIPIMWYVNIVNQVKTVLGDNIFFYVFSDGSDRELEPLLMIQGVKRVFYGSAIADILALSQAKLIIASGSSFSMWARFLGNTSCISYTNQMKEHICCGEENFEFEIGMNETLDEEKLDYIRQLYIE